MFSPKEMWLRLLEICQQREARNEPVFELSIKEERINNLPEGTAFIVPSYNLWPGRELPNVTAVSGEPIYIATDNQEEYIAMTRYGTFELCRGRADELWECNYALSEAVHDEEGCTELYALVIPDCSLSIADKRVTWLQPDTCHPTKQKPGRKLAFL